MAAALALTQLLRVALAAVTHDTHRLAADTQQQLQHIFIVRHGDKLAEYPACSAEEQDSNTLCFDESIYGNNSPLTPCGKAQANHTAEWLMNSSAALGPIEHLLSSPFLRTLETALALAARLPEEHASITVDTLLSESMDTGPPFRANKASLTSADSAALDAIQALQDESSAPAIPTPESPALYHKRVVRMGESLLARFAAQPGNFALFTHATPAFSIAHAICHSGDFSSAPLQRFVESQDAIGPAGVIHVARDPATGACVAVDQTNNLGNGAACGETKASKCEFAVCPAWYWPLDGEECTDAGYAKCHGSHPVPQSVGA